MTSNNACVGRHGHGVRASVRRGITVLVFTACTAGATPQAAEILKEMPVKGSLRRGEIVYVDDGECPPGEVKKIVGGNQKAGAARQVECVKRPKTSPDR